MSNNTIGRYSSMDPMSLEKRFSILPEELTLKNLIGAATTLENIRLCKFIEERMQNTKKP